MAACLAIRREVFCIEQGVSEELEIDGRDPQCRHFLLRLDGLAVGTARVRPLEPGVAKIERVAILARHRGGGLGSALMRHLLLRLDDAGCVTALLHAQAHSETFYRALGFATEGAPFEEAGIPHVRMTRESPNPGN
ncbi:MAG: GNAT family N-acetyltransferase [Defluviicoccus sp.]|nr:GNAT family N-acetyltransferase [Defluviicoccus sp.]MDE0384804.1 GNAT family N-acetyltransferase [Defluviicoccus sp.]